MEDERNLCYSVLQSVILLTDIHVEGTRDPRKGGKQNLISLSQQLLPSQTMWPTRPYRNHGGPVSLAALLQLIFLNPPLTGLTCDIQVYDTTLLFESSAFFTVIPHSSSIKFQGLNRDSKQILYGQSFHNYHNKSFSIESFPRASELILETEYLST